MKEEHERYNNGKERHNINTKKKYECNISAKEWFNNNAKKEHKHKTNIKERHNKNVKEEYKC